MHPRDHAGAGVVRVRLQHDAADGRRVGEHRLPLDADRQGVRDPPGLLGHLPQCVRAVQPLAAGQEPCRHRVLLCP